MPCAGLRIIEKDGYIECLEILDPNNLGLAFLSEESYNDLINKKLSPRYCQHFIILRLSFKSKISSNYLKATGHGAAF
jgi:hypothetical protein